MADLNELVRTRVRSLGGNCIIGYTVSLNGFDHKVEENEVFLIMSAIGDAVLLDDRKPMEAAGEDPVQLITEEEHKQNVQ